MHSHVKHAWERGSNSSSDWPCLCPGVPGLGRLEMGKDVPPVAKRLVLRCPASAQGDAVSDLIRRSVSTDDVDAAPYPDGPAAPFLRVLYQHDGGLEMRFDGLSRFVVPRDQPSRSTIPHLLQERRLYLRIVRHGDLVPDPAVRIAETGEGAEASGVGQCHLSPFVGLRQFHDGRTVGCFRAVETAFCMRAVAEGVLLRLPAAAQRIGRLEGIVPALYPFDRFALAVDADRLYGERDTAPDDIGAVPGDLDALLCFIPGHSSTPINTLDIPFTIL